MGRGSSNQQAQAGGLLFGTRTRGNGPTGSAVIVDNMARQRAAQLSKKISTVLQQVRRQHPQDLRRFSLLDSRVFSTYPLEMASCRYVRGNVASVELELLLAEADPEDWDRPDERAYGVLVREHGYDAGSGLSEYTSVLFTSLDEAVADLNSRELALRASAASLTAYGYRATPGAAAAGDVADQISQLATASITQQ